jgi:hypothetical protein
VDPLRQFGRIESGPAENGGVIDLYAAVQLHELEIAVAEREHQIPPDRPQDHLGSERPPFEGPILLYLNRLPTSCRATASPRSGW